MDASATKPDRALVVVLAVTALIVVTALVVVIVRGGPARLESGSPEAVVQQYATAVLSGDADAAAELLTPAAKAACGEFVEPWTSDIRITLISVDEDGASADVRVSIITGSGGLFGGSEWSESATFELTKVGGEWRIDTVPWQLAVCSE